MLDSNTKVVTCCANGQVRSVAARNILWRLLANKRVLACGLDRNDEETLRMLFAWADKVLIVGEQELLKKVPAGYSSKLVHVNVGADSWLTFPNDTLAKKLEILLRPLCNIGEI